MGNHSVPGSLHIWRESDVHICEAIKSQGQSFVLNHTDVESSAYKRLDKFLKSLGK